MSAPLLIPLPGNERMAQELASRLAAEVGHLELRKFPDGETYLRFATNPAGRRLSILCTLADPDAKILALIFAAATARELGAAEVGLIAPYLAYMRQDRRFNPGEAVTSRQVAQLLSRSFDWIVTVDPHLHRYSSLGEIYSIPTRVVHAASLISDWIRAHIENPVIIGPDRESEQWVCEVAKDAGAAYTVLEKVRHGDRDVEITIKDGDRLAGRTPVLVDDIISSGHTMREAARLVSENGTAKAVCIAVHGVFADRADEALARASARVVTSNSIPHWTNEIDIGGLLAGAVGTLIQGAAT